MRVLIFIYCFFLPAISFAQSSLPIIKASSKNVAIRDGAYFTKDAWTLSPEAKPDVYISDRTRKTKWVVFYTDIDSIKVKVEPGTRFSFIILLNGKDSCFTQIRSAIPTAENVKNKTIQDADTIPFLLTEFNAIHLQAVVNETDTLSFHLDLGSFDFKITKEALVKKTKLLADQPAALNGEVKYDFSKMKKVYKIKLGSLVFKDPVVMPTGLTAHQMDGRFGWNVFEGKIVEINYDKKILVIHPGLPAIPRGYVKSAIEFIHSYLCMRSTFIINQKKYTGNFLLDTGSDQAVILDSVWAAKNNFPTDLKLIKTSSFKDPRGVVYYNKILLAPSLNINGFKVNNIPTCLLGNNSPLGDEINYFGNDLLKRFNAFVDFKNDCIYLKPNSLMKLSFKDAQ